MQRQLVSIILAAGKGTRMTQAGKHKVCYEVAGTPVIVRALATYRQCGVSAHVLVVGDRAEQVMSTAAADPANLIYAFQPEQKGTGHAAKVGAALLEALEYDGDILLVAGDKVLEAGIVQRLLECFYAQNCELAFVVGPVESFPTAGHIVTGADGAIIGNLEVFDIARLRLLTALHQRAGDSPLPAKEAVSLTHKFFAREAKAAKALGAAWEEITAGHSVDRDFLDRHFRAEDYALNFNNRSYAPELLANVRYVNLSVYLFKAAALFRTLKKLGSANAQHEEYLTDTIAMLAAEGAKLAMVPVHYPEEAMAFNTEDEFRAIEEYYEKREE